jgi:hypothetical protein
MKIIEPTVSFRQQLSSTNSEAIMPRSGSSTPHKERQIKMEQNKQIAIQKLQVKLTVSEIKGDPRESGLRTYLRTMIMVLKNNS